MENPVTTARVNRLWSKVQLAARAKLSLDTIDRAERGEVLRPLTQERIARALRVPREELFASEAEEASA